MKSNLLEENEQAKKNGSYEITLFQRPWLCLVGLISDVIEL